MSPKIHFQPGSEQWVGWAKTRLRALSSLRNHLGLPVLTRAYAPAAGVLVWLKASRFGDWIHITAGAGFIALVSDPLEPLAGWTLVRSGEEWAPRLAATHELEFSLTYVSDDDLSGTILGEDTSIQAVRSSPASPSGSFTLDGEGSPTQVREDLVVLETDESPYTLFQFGRAPGEGEARVQYDPDAVTDAATAAFPGATGEFLTAPTLSVVPGPHLRDTRSFFVDAGETAVKYSQDFDILNSVRDESELDSDMLPPDGDPVSATSPRLHSGQFVPSGSLVPYRGFSTDIRFDLTEAAPAGSFSTMSGLATQFGASIPFGILSGAGRTEIAANIAGVATTVHAPGSYGDHGLFAAAHATHYYAGGEDYWHVYVAHRAPTVDLVTDPPNVLPEFPVAMVYRTFVFRGSAQIGAEESVRVQAAATPAATWDSAESVDVLVPYGAGTDADGNPWVVGLCVRESFGASGITHAGFPAQWSPDLSQRRIYTEHAWPPGVLESDTPRILHTTEGGAQAGQIYAASDDSGAFMVYVDRQGTPNSAWAVPLGDLDTDLVQVVEGDVVFPRFSQRVI